MSFEIGQEYDHPDWDAPVVLLEIRDANHDFLRGDKLCVIKVWHDGNAFVQDALLSQLSEINKERRESLDK